MGSKKVVTFHWCCDRKGCNEHGSGETFPLDWRYMTIFQRTGTSVKASPADAKVLLCPRCADLFKRELDLPAIEVAPKVAAA